MIHELIDPKKKTNRGTASKNTKSFQEPKTVSEDINFEGSDTENRESSSTIFIPPWLRNSLGLNQRSNLSQSTGGADLKSTKLPQRGKEPSQNEFECLKTNTIEEDSAKKLTDNSDILPDDCPEEVTVTRDSDNVETTDNSKERPVPIYWDVGRKDSEVEWSCTNEEPKPLKKDSKMTTTDVLTTGDLEKLKEDDKKKPKVIKQKNRLRKRIAYESKQSDLEKNEMDFLLEMKARAALDNYMKGDVNTVTSEIKQLEAKLLLLSAKSHDLNGAKLNAQDLRMEVKPQGCSIEQLDKVFEQVKDVNLRGVIRNSDFLSKNLTEKRREEKESRSLQKGTDESKMKGDKDSILSTDDENDIKRFSEFLSKNKNLDEKRKCLEEVRNYFERKRRTRLTKRRCMEEEKGKLTLDIDRKDDHPKEKTKSREVYRGRKSKFALCDEEVVEKAVDEALQKFVELYHFRVTPSVMGNMKKNILQAITTDSSDNSKLNETSPSEDKKDSSNTQGKESGKGETNPVVESELSGIPTKETPTQKEVKKRNGKNANENLSEQVSKRVSEQDVIEDEKLKRLKKEFDIFLHSVQTHIDVTNLKLQSIILEKEEQTSTAQNVQFVYNFTKKALEPEKPDYWHSLKEALELKNRRDVETQTTTDLEPAKRNVKIQALEHKLSCEQSLQTETQIYVTQDTQTDRDGMTMQEIKELKSYDVHPGLYRMVRSKEAGKFYLYPEQLDDEKEGIVKSNSSTVKEKKIKKRNLVNVLSKERQVFYKDRERTKLKRGKRASTYTVAHAKCSSMRKKKKEGTSENSINCLYFRNIDKKTSDSVSSKKEGDYAEDNLTGRLDDGDDLGVVPSKDDHLGCFWFWNGEKITPGCDLKTHVENLLKEKLKHITAFESSQNEFAINEAGLPKKENEQSLINITEKNLDVRNANALFCFGNLRAGAKQSSLPLTDNASFEERKRVMEHKKEEKERTDDTQEKAVKNVGTRDSQMKYVSLNVSKHKVNQGGNVGRKSSRRNITLKQGKAMNLKKAEDFLRAVQELKKMKMELQNLKKENTSDTESLVDCSTSTSCSKNATEYPLSMMLELKQNHEMEEISTSDIKSRIKKLISLVDREVQTADVYDGEDSADSQTTGIVLDNPNNLDLIGSVLNRINQKERESLWNDVRSFIKTKLGKDINDSNTREVCIEIEQDMPKVEQGKTKHSVLAKGHYTKNEGDVEVEIDLTLEDLARILRQRQKKNKKRSMYRSSKSKNLLSSSSAQSDFTREEIKKYHKYLHRFAKLGEGLNQDKETKTLKKHKGN